MRFRCDAIVEYLSSEYARALKKLQNWHPWFAWRPVRTLDGTCVWLETIQRRGKGTDLIWEYKLP